MAEYMIYVSIIFGSFLHWFQNVLDLLSLLLDDLLFICVFWTGYSFLGCIKLMLVVPILHHWIIIFKFKLNNFVVNVLYLTWGRSLILHKLPVDIRIKQMVVIAVVLGIHSLSFIKLL